ncbi:MAG: winged helix-turn-helix transcriptional regulator [Shimia sp.]|uniref:winged helix-turn-helix transcriptional regulator n=1 Tax=Shimia sp. TaxID=1954381 RepID=UPI004059EA37
MADADNHANCPMDPLLRAVTGRWTTYILWRLVQEGSLRFGELMGLVPSISAKVLVDRLRMLERNDLLIRTQKDTIPPEVSYELTEDGKALHASLKGLHLIALDWRARGWQLDEGFPETTDSDAREQEPA